MPSEQDGFARRLAWIAAGALVVRLVYVVAIRPRTALPAPDAFLFHHGANLLADGYGFIDPYRYVQQGLIQPFADHPPAYPIYLAAFSTVGFTSPLAHMVASTLLGTAAVVMTGLLGREVGGSRVGLVAAGLAAVYAELVIADGSLQAESMAALVVTTLAYAVLRYRRAPSLGSAAWIGALIGWAGMTRPEQLLLSVVVVTPVIFWRTNRDLRSRLVALGTAAAVSLAVVLPWVAHNLERFHRPVLISSNLDYTLATTNCDRTWHGTRIGFWDNRCNVDALAAQGMNFRSGDTSDRAAVFREAGLDYLRANVERLPLVMSARVLRSLSLWDPIQQVRLDEHVEGREPMLSQMSILSFYVLAGGAVIGARTLARRRRPLLELVGPPAIVLVMAVLFMGNARYRTPAAGVTCVLAAIGTEALRTRHAARAARVTIPCR